MVGFVAFLLLGVEVFGLPGAAGGLINARDLHGRQALHYACQATAVTLVEVLTSHGAEVNALDNYGHAPEALIGRPCHELVQVLRSAAHT